MTGKKAAATLGLQLSLAEGINISPD